MNFTNTDSQHMGEPQANGPMWFNIVYRRLIDEGQVYMQLYEQVKVPVRVHALVQVKVPVDDQIKPIKTKIKQEIYK